MEELFARLQKTTNSDTNQQSNTPSTSQSKSASGYNQPSVSSPVYSPAPSGPQPHHASHVLSPNTSTMNTPQPDGSAGNSGPRNTDLLSLLKFRQASSNAATPPTGSYEQPSFLDTSSAASAARPVNAADIVAGFSRKPAAVSSPSALSRPELRGEASGSSSNPQDFLLKLLNQAPKPNVATDSSPAQTPQMETLKAADLTRNASDEVVPPADGHPETVAERLSNVGEAVDKQIEEVLASVGLAKAHGDSAPAPTSDAELAVQEAAMDIKKDLKNPETRDEIEGGMPPQMKAAFEETIEAAAAGPPETTSTEDWEKAAKKMSGTYTFPMQPFKAIHITEFEKEPPVIPLSMTMDIAKVKRPFDQIDRNLVAATQNLMIYTLKNGGLRVIRQETGGHKEIFKNVPERIFNVSASVKKHGDRTTEIVLATGVNGSVFWVPLSHFAGSDEPALTDEPEEAQGFIFPPVPSSDENTSGGQLKTRIKPSSRHPEYFAYGRGKSIYIVYPRIARDSIYCDDRTQIVKSEKYLKEHMLRIQTGKAGKDFIFSSDDTLILSLDKAGRLKFWDLKELLNVENYENTTGNNTPLEVKTPIMTLATCGPTEKSWPTSILLIDKERPMTKGIAHRYVVIGLKQNHTLQLWDLMLGKPVQEIHFPHEQESDGICSVVFHPKTSILTVAHPTRNSIYFMHLSIPPYSLTPMNQSRFVQKIAAKDADLPAPQSTLIVNGIREYSFSKTHTIRSVDILNEPGAHYGDEGIAFVLYVMHSNGITELKVDRPLLGLSESGNRIVDGIDAMKIPGAIKVQTIKPLPPPVQGNEVGSVASESTVAPAAPPSPLKATPTRTPKAAEKDVESSNDKANKKKKKKTVNEEFHASTPSITKPTLFAPPAELIQSTKAESSKRVTTKNGPSESKSAEPLSSEDAHTEAPAAPARDLASTGGSVDAAAFEALLKSELDTLHHNIAQDRLEQDAKATSRQEMVLKAVSRTLTENVEDSLARVVTEGLTKVVVPPLKDMVNSAIDRNLSASFNQAMKVGVPRELQKSLPVALNQALKDKTIMHGVSDQLSQSVAAQVDAHFADAMQNTVAPTIKQHVSNAAKNMTAEMQRQFSDQLRTLAVQKQQDDAKIERLYEVIGGLQRTIAEMVAAQQTFQQETLGLLAQMKIPHGVTQATSPAGKTPVSSQALVPSPAARERTEIQDLFARNEVEEATLRWMHSDRKIPLFDEVFLYTDPRFLQSLSPLIILSVAATVTEEMHTNITPRLNWVEACISAIESMESNNVTELKDIMPRILDVLVQRIQTTYMTVSQNNFQDPVLKLIHASANRVSALKMRIS